MRIPKLGKSLNKLNKKSGKFLTKALTALGIIKELSEGNNRESSPGLKAEYMDKTNPNTPSSSTSTESTSTPQEDNLELKLAEVNTDLDTSRRRQSQINALINTSRRTTLDSITSKYGVDLSPANLEVTPTKSKPKLRAFLSKETSPILSN